METIAATNTKVDEGFSDYYVKFISDFIYQRSGIVLGESKRYLIDSRLRSVARVAGLPDVPAVCSELSNQSPQLETLVLDALTTNETSWFRDGRPFEALEKTILPAIKRDKGSKMLQIWSAACSSGQEAYSIAMKIKESHLLPDWHIRIIATDISSRVMEQAQEGLYSQLEVNRGLPIKLLIKYFTQIGDMWKIEPELRAMVSFREHLLQKEASALGTFDLVFCRNVLIYFDLETKQKILGNIHRVMTSNGLLSLGGSETTLNVSKEFDPIRMNDTVYYAKTATNHTWKS